MNEKEKIIDILKSSIAWKYVLYKCKDILYENNFEQVADTLIENGIGDIAEWKARAEKAETELEKYKRALSCACKVSAAIPTKELVKARVDCFLRQAEKEIEEEADEKL